MTFNIHVYLHGDSDETINDILKIVLDNQLNIKKMNTELEALSAEVAETKTVVKSAIVLIDGISQQIKDAGTDKVKLKELTDSLDADNAALAAKVAENTAAEEETPTP